MSELCKHFGTCGGCLYQDESHGAYRARKELAVAQPLARNSIAATLEEMIVVPPKTRRRATFKAAKIAGEMRIGFHARQSHDIVDMQECLVLSPGLFAAVPRLRKMMAALLRDGEKAELHVTETDTGLDIAIDWSRKLKPALTTEIARWARELKAARIIVGKDIAVELARPIVTFGKAQVPMPPRAFLQPTREGERVLQGLVAEALDRSKCIADLFAGCGTFALTLAEKARVHAVERDTAALEALGDAVRHTQGLKPVTTESRDLFKLPITPPELKRFDAVCLDPPRAGALAQVKEIAASKIKRIAYVSCNPESFARDARVLVDAGFEMAAVIPLDQFLWSSHIELMASFIRT